MPSSFYFARRSGLTFSKLNSDRIEFLVSDFQVFFRTLEQLLKTVGRCIEVFKNCIQLNITHVYRFLLLEILCNIKCVKSFTLMSTLIKQLDHGCTVSMFISDSIANSLSAISQ